MKNFTKKVKEKLKKMVGNEGLIPKNEYRVYMVEKGKYGWAAIDHVWLKEIPHPSGPKQLVVVAFEITEKFTQLWNSKKMKGDVTNLRISNASLGVLVIPTIKELKKQIEESEEKLKQAGEKWIKGIEEYLNALRELAKPMEVEVWCYDDKNGQFSVFLPKSKDDKS